MTEIVYNLLLDEQSSTISTLSAGLNVSWLWKSRQNTSFKKMITLAERVERRALTLHCDKAPAVAHRIGILASKMAIPNYFVLLKLRLSKHISPNLAELEALIQYGHSKAVWDIAYLTRKKSLGTITVFEVARLACMQEYHNHPEVLRLTRLQMAAQRSGISGEDADSLKELLHGADSKTLASV